MVMQTQSYILRNNATSFFFDAFITIFTIIIATLNVVVVPVKPNTHFLKSLESNQCGNYLGIDSSR